MPITNDETTFTEGRAEVTVKGETFTFFTTEGLMRVPDTPMLVEEMIPAHSLGMICGPSGVGKTFLAVDLASSIASGERWLGRPTAQSTVLYVVAEGVGARFARRLVAWVHVRKPKAASRIVCLLQPLALSEEKGAEAVTKAILSLPEEWQPQLIVIDTLARCVWGDENSTKDMGAVVRNLDNMRLATGSAVLLVHHTRKSDGVPRGSGAVEGALDYRLQVTKKEGRGGAYLEVTAGKMKDYPEFPPIRCTLSSVEVDELGNTSCVVTSTGKSYEKLLAVMSYREQSLSQLAKVLDLHHTEVRRMVDEAIEDGYVDVVQVGDGRKGMRYVLAFEWERVAEWDGEGEDGNED